MLLLLTMAYVVLARAVSVGRGLGQLVGGTVKEKGKTGSGAGCDKTYQPGRDCGASRNKADRSALGIGTGGGMSGYDMVARSSQTWRGRRRLYVRSRCKNQPSSGGLPDGKVDCPTIRIVGGMPLSTESARLVLWQAERKKKLCSRAINVISVPNDWSRDGRDDDYSRGPESSKL